MDDLLAQALSLAAATLRVATPLVLAALGGLLSERAGVVDLSLEGKMLMGAFAAGAVAAVTGSPWLGLGAAVAAAVGMSLVHGLASITYHGNQVVSGIAINILAAGLTPTLAVAWFAQAGRTPLLSGDARFGPVHLPGAEAVAGVPGLGPLYAHLLSGHNVLVYGALAAVAGTGWLIYRSRFGLRLRAVGENPAAVDTAGLSVPLLRYQAVMLSGVLCGVAGAYLSTAHGGGFVQGMTAGKGYLAVAALIFGQWRPVGTLIACLVFAFADVLQARLQGVPLPGVGEIPVQFIQMLPYGLTILLLAGFVGRARAPKAIGQPYQKE